ncbi:unnamed protein product [Ectocarpus sp. 13 AM-2016]
MQACRELPKDSCARFVSSWCRIGLFALWYAYLEASSDRCTGLG